MRNALFIITAAAMSVGGVSAQAESVEDILQDIQNYGGPDIVAPAAPAAVVAEDVSGMPAAPAADVDAIMEESRDLYVAGEFDEAQKGFAAVAKLDPENKMAPIYLRKLLERDLRTVEKEGMDVVSSSWCTDLVLRSYEISDSALERMQLVNLEDKINVENRFPEVSFSDGAFAVYQPELEKIFVRNTRENLQVLEEIFEAMDVANLDTDVDQVEIETKFVEVSEGTLEELGFEWNFQNSVDVNAAGTDLVVNDGSGLFSDALRGSNLNGVFAQPDSLGPYGAAAAGAAGATGWGTFRLEDTFSSSPATMDLNYSSSDPLDILISALDQSSGADVLSAPRVTTRSGEEATIRVGELHYYPEVYEGDSSQATMLNVSYQDFEEKLLGIQLAVTPDVDGDQIELELTPRISALVGWQQYELAPANTIYTHRWENPATSFYHDPVVAKLPIIQVREVETAVTIADGSTIGMGGLINEKVESFCDKVPVLGSMPLIGRMFRTEGERAVKRNLMMFVTAKKVTPYGRVDTSRSFEEGSADDEGGESDDSFDDLFAF